MMTREEFERVVGHACKFGRSTVGVSGAKHQLLIHDAEQRKTIERLRETFDEIKRWCLPSSKKVQPTSMKGSFFRGAVTPTEEAVLALNVIRLADKALAETEPRDERETNP